MKAIMVMFDTLSRRVLEPYGCKTVQTPNFQRLAARAITFDNCYVGSMPCMPARRELHTGRYNFLHRSWGPLEPFDDSMPQILRDKGVYTHLVTDHPHYWEDGGATYHTRYNSFEFFRGQEGDSWKGEVREPDIPDVLVKRISQTARHDWVNRKYIREERSFPQSQTFAAGIEFVRCNHLENDWFLQIETFDPHEPFYSPQHYKELYPHAYDGPHFDWPPTREVQETPEQVEHCRYEYAALVSMCDAQLGKVLDVMDELNLWDDTLLIVNTDHGFLLGEHGWWSKTAMPYYQEIAHIPLFVWDPRSRIRGERRSSLVQMIDIPSTLLDFFDAPVPASAQGHSLKKTIADDTPVREAALFGVHGGHVNCTDGRYVYMRAPQNSLNEPIYNYTLMPTHMRGYFSIQELSSMKLADPFEFTKGLSTLRVPAMPWMNAYRFGTMLFDVREDPGQDHPIDDPMAEQRMATYLVKLMKRNDAPPEQYQRLGFLT